MRLLDPIARIVLLGALLAGPASAALAQGGIGGTGITAIGVIQRFGSIFVNGIEYRLRPGTRYFRDGHEASAQTLALGDRVFVTAHGPLSRPSAATVRVQHTLIGPVTRAWNGRLEVLGIPIQPARGAIMPRGTMTTLHAGTWVAVSGLSRGGHAILATRIHIRTRRSPLLVRGTVEAQIRGRIRIHGAWFRTAGRWPRLHGVIVARGRYQHGRAILVQARPAYSLRHLSRGFVPLLGWVAGHGPVRHYRSLALYPTGSLAPRLARTHHAQIAVATGIYRNHRIFLTGFTTHVHALFYGLAAAPPSASAGARTDRRVTGGRPGIHHLVPPAIGRPPHPVMIHPSVTPLRPMVNLPPTAR